MMQKFFISFFFGGTEPRAYICKAGTLPIEPQLQPIFLWLFWRCELQEAKCFSIKFNTVEQNLSFGYNLGFLLESRVLSYCSRIQG
jgi:hypothetical protein